MCIRDSLYSGPWVAERLVVFDEFLDEHPEEIVPVVRDILRSGLKYTAVDAFAALQRLAELRAEVGRIWRGMDVLVVPTIGRTFTVDEVLAQPIAANTMLGHYTHFGNLLDLLGISVPQGTTADGRPMLRCCSAMPSPTTRCCILRPSCSTSRGRTPPSWNAQS